VQTALAVAAPAVDEPARLRALEMLDVLHRGTEERFDRITRMAQALFGVSAAAVTLVTDSVQVHKSQCGSMALGDGPRETAFCDHTIRDSATLVVEDATADECFAHFPSVTGSPHTAVGNVFLSRELGFVVTPKGGGDVGPTWRLIRPQLVAMVALVVAGGIGAVRLHLGLATAQGTYLNLVWSPTTCWSSASC